MVALPDRTAFQGMRQQTVANARNLDSVAIAPPVSTAPPPRPEVDPAVRAPTPTDLFRTANDSFNNRLNSDQNYLNLQQQSQQLSQSLEAKQREFLLSRGISNPIELVPRNMAEFQNNPRQPIIEELRQFINSQPEMQQLQNIGQQVSTYVNNTYAADLQRIRELRDQEALYLYQLYGPPQQLPYQQQQQLFNRQNPQLTPEQFQKAYDQSVKESNIKNIILRRQQQQLQTPQFKPAPPPPRPEVDPEEVRRGQQILQPAPPQISPPPPKPEVDPEEKISSERPQVSFKPADTTGAKHSGQGIGGQGGIPALPNREPQITVDPIRQPLVPKPIKPEVDPEENIPNTLVSKPKRKAGMAPSQYGGINTNVRGLMG